jgi:hypothetical protein
VSGPRQEMLLDIPRPSMDSKTAALLAWLVTDPSTMGDYQRICRAVVKAAEERHDIISANDVRKHLVDADGRLVVRPSRLGATFRRLALQQVLIPRGFVASTDHKSRNGNKAVREYQFRPDRIPNMDQH